MMTLYSYSKGWFMEEKRNSNNNAKKSNGSPGLLLGILFGALLGITIDELAVGIALGAGVGTAIGSNIPKNNNEHRGDSMILKDAEGKYKISLEEERAVVRQDSEEVHYAIIESRREVENAGYCVLNNIYVNEGMEAPFEARFLKRQSNLVTVDGFKAIRVMKAVSGPYYIILTLWEDEQSFHNWQDSEQYGETHRKRGTKSGLDREVVDREQSFNVRFQLENE
ncbi:antibiotic biosynthesis monooxygenase family protein [Salinicoccus bachuensis]|uniref:Signal transduction protein TRAP n=1 Tax=Salinicoccus bachuensis TaxID=3136731 RepID=A0ABZ3CHY7_9STAP